MEFNQYMYYNHNNLFLFCKILIYLSCCKNLIYLNSKNDKK